MLARIRLKALPLAKMEHGVPEHVLEKEYREMLVGIQENHTCEVVWIPFPNRVLKARQDAIFDGGIFGGQDDCVRAPEVPKGI